MSQLVAELIAVYFLMGATHFTFR